MNKKKLHTRYAFLRAIHTLTVLGEAIAYVGAIVFRGLFELLYLIFLALWNISSKLRHSIADTCSVIYNALCASIRARVTAVRKVVSNILRAKKDGRKISLYIIGSRKHTGLLPVFVNIAFLALSVVFSVYLISSHTVGAYALKLTIDNTYYGYVSDEQVCAEAINIVNSRISAFGGNVAASVQIEPKLTLTRLSDVPAELTKFQLADKIIENLGYSVHFGYGFYVNDKFYGAVLDKAPLQTALADIIKENETKARKIYGDDIYVQFADNINADNPGFYLDDSIVKPEYIINQISGYKQVESYYVVQDGDVPSTICDKLDLTQDAIEKLNPGFSTEMLHGGDKLLIQSAKPVFPISVVVEQTGTESVPFNTHYKVDNTLARGETRVESEGEEGENNVVYKITYTDDAETSRETVNVTRTSDPVDRVVYINSLDAQTEGLTGVGGGMSGSAAENGSEIEQPPIKSLLRPIEKNVGFADTAFSADNRGIDIICAVDTAVHAAADGVVTYSGRSYPDYGKCVIIQHRDGISTLYAHCGELRVAVGQRVTAGQVVATVGATGQAATSGLRFEVIGSNGSKRDPMLYIKE